MNKLKKMQIVEAVELIAMAREIIDEVYADERYYYDNMPKGLRFTDEHEDLRQNVRALEEFRASLDALNTDGLQEIVDG